MAKYDLKEPCEGFKTRSTRRAPSPNPWIFLRWELFIFESIHFSTDSIFENIRPYQSQESKLAAQRMRRQRKKQHRAFLAVSAVTQVYVNLSLTYVCLALDGMKIISLLKKGWSDEMQNLKRGLNRDMVCILEKVNREDLWNKGKIL